MHLLDKLQGANACCQPRDPVWLDKQFYRYSCWPSCAPPAGRSVSSRGSRGSEIRDNGISYQLRAAL